MKKIILPLVLLCATVFFAYCNKKAKSNTEAKDITKYASPKADSVVANIDTARVLNWNIIPNQRFSLPHTGISHVMGKKGFKIEVDPTKLMRIDNKPIDAPIEVSIIEVTDDRDFVAYNATTESNGRLLISGGSYYVNMVSNGCPLKIRNGYALQASFPTTNENGMKLFYGDRTTTGTLNWNETQTFFKREVPESISFIDGPVDYPQLKLIPDSIERFVFDSLSQQVYYMSKMLILSQIMDTFSLKKVPVKLDTFYMGVTGWEIFRMGDTNTLIKKGGKKFGQYWTMPHYKIVRTEEARRLEKLKKQNDSLRRAYEITLAERQKSTVAGQICAYYQTVPIAQLGWLNVDKIYPERERADVPIDIPITLKSNRIEYFIVFKTFKGMISGSLLPGNPVLPKLPVGESVQLIAFAKKNNQVLHSAIEFKIGKNPGRQPMHFEEIPIEKMKQIFGNNVKIT